MITNHVNRHIRAGHPPFRSPREHGPIDLATRPTMVHSTRDPVALSAATAGLDAVTATRA